MNEIIKVIGVILIVAGLLYFIMVVPSNSLGDYFEFRDEYCVKHFGSEGFVGSSKESSYDVINCGYLVGEVVVMKSLPFLDIIEMREELNKE